jgi:hypothetical protein
MYGKEFSFHLKNLWERYNLDYTKRNTVKEAWIDVYLT